MPTAALAIVATLLVVATTLAIGFVIHSDRNPARTLPDANREPHPKEPELKRAA